MAGYSRKIKSVSDLKDGRPLPFQTTRPTLAARCCCCKREKLITLKPDTGLLPTALDITANPKQLKIMELEGHSCRACWTTRKWMSPSSALPISGKQGCRRCMTKASLLRIKLAVREHCGDARRQQRRGEREGIYPTYQSPEVAKAAETIFNGGRTGLVNDLTENGLFNLARLPSVIALNPQCQLDGIILLITPTGG